MREKQKHYTAGYSSRIDPAVYYIPDMYICTAAAWQAYSSAAGVQRTWKGAHKDREEEQDGATKQKIKNKKNFLF